MRKEEIAELEEARAMLERNKEQMRKQYTINKPNEALDKLLEGQSMLLGPKTELGLRRILRDIKASGNDDVP
jgi:hypothetical protein